MTYTSHLMLAALASASLLVLRTPAMAQTVEDSSSSSEDVVTDDVVTDEVDTPVDGSDKADEIAETGMIEDSGEPVPTEWVQRDGDVDVMYSFMSTGGSDDMGEDIAAQAAEQAANQAMDHIDASTGETPLP